MPSAGLGDSCSVAGCAVWHSGLQTRLVRRELIPAALRGSARGGGRHGDRQLLLGALSKLWQWGDHSTASRDLSSSPALPGVERGAHACLLRLPCPHPLAGRGGMTMAALERVEAPPRASDAQGTLAPKGALPLGSFAAPAQRPVPRPGTRPPPGGPEPRGTLGHGGRSAQKVCLCRDLRLARFHVHTHSVSHTSSRSRDHPSRVLRPGRFLPGVGRPGRPGHGGQRQQGDTACAA